MDVQQAKIQANHNEWMAKASQERMEAPINISIETMEACLGKIEANQGTV
jgi:hypothetical protein